MKSIVLASALPPLLGGCMAAAMAAPYAAVGAAQMLSNASQERYANVSITATPRYEHGTMRRVSFVTSGTNTGSYTGINDVFIGHLTSEFLKAGFDVIEDSRLSSRNNAIQVPTVGTTDSVESIAESIQLDGMFVVSAQAESAVNMGFLGIGADATNGIVDANLKLTDAETGQTLLIISASYKKAKASSEVAADIAGKFREFSQTESDVAPQGEAS